MAKWDCADVAAAGGRRAFFPGRRRYLRVELEPTSINTTRNVDDDPLQAEEAAMSFEMCEHIDGLEIIRAFGVQDAKAKARDKHPRFVITGVQIPVGRGRDLVADLPQTRGYSFCAKHAADGVLGTPPSIEAQIELFDKLLTERLHQ